MMMIFQDVHTYLIISFLLMLFLLYKFGYKNFDASLKSYIENISSNIKNSEQNKTSALSKLDMIKIDETSNNEKIEHLHQNAKIEVENINKISDTRLNKLMESKSYEYQETLKRLDSMFMNDIQSIIIDNAIKNTQNKIINQLNSRALHSKTIDNSISMFEDFLNK